MFYLVTEFLVEKNQVNYSLACSSALSQREKVSAWILCSRKNHGAKKMLQLSHDNVLQPHRPLACHLCALFRSFPHNESLAQATNLLLIRTRSCNHLSVV